MIAVLIFYIHIVVAVTIFVRRWQEEGLPEGFLGLAFFGVAFSVLWSVSGFVSKIVWTKAGFADWLDRDALSLLLLGALELVLYRVYFWKFLFSPRHSS
jgi:hypothetical protein